MGIGIVRRSRAHLEGLITCVFARWLRWLAYATLHMLVEAMTELEHFPLDFMANRRRFISSVLESRRIDLDECTPDSPKKKPRID